MARIMNKTKIVKTKILPLLLEMGFLYHKDVKSWWFTRKIGEVEQYVVLVDLWQSNLRLEFFSNEYQAKTIEGANLIEKKEEYQIEIGKGIAYETEEEFETIIEEYKRVIQQHLESCFKEISSEITEIRPTKEMELYLFENHKDLIEVYQKKYNLLHTSNIKTIDNGL